LSQDKFGKRRAPIAGSNPLLFGRGTNACVTNREFVIGNDSPPLNARPGTEIWNSTLLVVYDARLIMNGVVLEPGASIDGVGSSAADAESQLVIVANCETRTTILAGV